jgi:hypothetical protein
MHKNHASLLGGMGAISLVAGGMLLAGQAFADTTDWSLSTGGIYTSTGSDGVLNGNNIPILSVAGDGTPVKNGSSLSILDGLLNFTTGSYDGTVSNWAWGAGGVLNVTGCIVGVTAKQCTGSNNVALLSDDFQSLQIVNQGGFTDAVFGNITGDLNASVAAYFGVPVNFSTASFTATIAAIGTPGLGLIGTNLSGLIKADPPSARVAEYWSIVESLEFFGLALVCAAALLRFRILRLPTL